MALTVEERRRVFCCNGNLDRADKQAGGNRHTSKATCSAKKPHGRYDYVDLIARDKASLDIFWLKDDSLEVSANLPNPDIIAQEIVDDLEAALEQFRLIANDIGNDAEKG